MLQITRAAGSRMQLDYVTWAQERSLVG